MVSVNDEVIKLLVDRIDQLQRSMDEARAERRETNREIYRRLTTLEQNFAKSEHHFVALQKLQDTHVEPEEWFNSKLAKIFWTLVVGAIVGWLTRGML